MRACPESPCFLAYLGAVTGRESYAALAGAALAAIRPLRGSRHGPSRIGIGGFDGLGGVIYALSHLGGAGRRTDLLLEAHELVWVLPPALINLTTPTKTSTWCSGAQRAAILALRSLHRCLPSDQLTAVALRWGPRLRAEPRPLEPARLRHRGDCLRAARTPRVDRYRSLPRRRARLRLHAARAPQRPTRWRRPGSATPVVPSGSTGVALSRLFSGSDSLERSGARTTFQGPCKWCALPASAEPFAVARRPREPRTAGAGGGRVERRGHGVGRGRMSAILSSIEQHGWRCGTPLGVETPGLLAGLAGIGYGILRSARPDIVPSVLALEAPLPQGGTWRMTASNRQRRRPTHRPPASVTPLFRREALDAKRQKTLGDVLLVQPLATRMLTLIAVVLACAVIAFGYWGKYTRKAHVIGYLVPTAGLIMNYSRETGSIVDKQVVEGQRVSKGDVLFVISMERRSTESVDLPSRRDGRTRSTPLEARC